MRFTNAVFLSTNFISMQYFIYLQWTNLILEQKLIIHFKAHIKIHRYAGFNMIGKRPKQYVNSV